MMRTVTRPAVKAHVTKLPLTAPLQHLSTHLHRQTSWYLCHATFATTVQGCSEEGAELGGRGFTAAEGRRHPEGQASGACCATDEAWTRNRNCTFLCTATGAPFCHVLHWFAEPPKFFFIVAVLEAAQVYVPKGSTLGDVVLIVLMKLRLALLNADLGYRFGLLETTVGKIMKVNIPVLSSQLKWFIIWPTKDDTSRTLPTLVRRRYPDCRAIIDYTECRIERPLAFGARSETYSHYKRTITVIFLIGITPNGAVSFVSKCWFGRSSDKKLVQSSGFLDKLADGDVILADRGFLIKEDVARRGVRLEVPALTRGKKQLPAREGEEAPQISKLRIHVERAIGRMKVYRILRDGSL
ncbi:unnamed protein product [Ixodes pacificus]